MINTQFTGLWGIKVRFWLCMAAVAILDQWSKWMVAAYIAPGKSVEVLPGVVWFSHVFNRGAAFSILQGQTLYFIIAAAVVVLGLIAYNLFARPQPLLQLITGLMAGGALGNLVDRFRLGHVVDFIDLRFWPVFNLADTAIVMGGMLLVIYFIWLDRDGQSDAG